MSKMCVCVVVYSLVLIGLFVAMCYLMSNINPPVKPDERSADEAYIFTVNDVPNDRISYGLQKVYDDYTEQSLSSKINNIMLKPVKAETELTDYLNDTHTKSQISQNNFKSTTKPMNIVKGRRSIKDDNENDFESEETRSLLLNIKGFEGQPLIEIKFVPAKYPYNCGVTNEPVSILSSDNNNLVFDSDNNIREASIVMAKNGMIILNVNANSIDILNKTPTQKNAETYKENDTIHHEINSTNTNNKSHQAFKETNMPTESEKDIIETSLLPVNMYTVWLTKNNFVKSNISEIYNNTKQNLTTSKLTFGIPKDLSTISNTPGQILTLKETGQFSNDQNEINIENIERQSTPTAEFKETMHATNNIEANVTQTIDTLLYEDMANTSSNLRDDFVPQEIAT